jgi:hypothetical protein
MKKAFNFILIIPFIGLSSIYFYVLITIISLHSFEFYKIDPKQSAISFIYEPTLIISMLGIFIFIPLGIFILLIDYFKFKGNLTSNIFKWIYLIGVVLTIFLHYVDLGYCQIWFFD